MYFSKGKRQITFKTFNSLIKQLKELRPIIKIDMNIYAEEEILEVIFERSKNKGTLNDYNLIEITFDDMRDICIFCKIGVGDLGIRKKTCRHKQNVPEGHSWGKCKLSVCPIVKSS